MQMTQAAPQQQEPDAWCDLGSVVLHVMLALLLAFNAGVVGYLTYFCAAHVFKRS